MYILSIYDGSFKRTQTHIPNFLWLFKVSPGLLGGIPRQCPRNLTFQSPGSSDVFGKHGIRRW